MYWTQTSANARNDCPDQDTPEDVVARLAAQAVVQGREGEDEEEAENESDEDESFDEHKTLLYGPGGAFWTGATAASPNSVSRSSAYHAQLTPVWGNFTFLPL